MENKNRVFCLLTGALIIIFMFIHQAILVQEIEWESPFVPVLYLVYLFVYYLHLYTRVSKIYSVSGPDSAALFARTLIFIVIVCLFICHTMEHEGSRSLYSSIIQIIVSFIIELLLPESILKMIFAEKKN